MTDDRDSRVPSRVGSRGSDPELRDIPFSLPLAVHGWLVRHGYVLRNNRSALGLTINYIVLLTIPVFPLLVYVHWVATRSFPEGDEIDFKGVVSLLVAGYLFGLAAMHLLAPWGNLTGAKEMSVLGGVVLVAITVYKLVPD